MGANQIVQVRGSRSASVTGTAGAPSAGGVRGPSSVEPRPDGGHIADHQDHPQLEGHCSSQAPCVEWLDLSDV